MGARPKARSLRQRVYLRPLVGTLRRNLTDDRPGKFPARTSAVAGRMRVAVAMISPWNLAGVLIRISYRKDTTCEITFI